MGRGPSPNSKRAKLQHDLYGTPLPKTAKQLQIEERAEVVKATIEQRAAEEHAKFVMEGLKVLADAPEDLEEARIRYAVRSARTEADGEGPVLTPVQRKRAPQYLALLARGYRPAEIAEIMDLGRHTVRGDLYYLRKGGYLEDALEKFDRHTIPAALDTIHDAIEAGDAEVAIEAAKGRGFFRQHTQNKNEGPAPSTVLALQILMPDGRELGAAGTGPLPPVAVPNQVQGANQPALPEAVIEGEVAEVQTANPDLVGLRDGSVTGAAMTDADWDSLERDDGVMI